MLMDFFTVLIKLHRGSSRLFVILVENYLHLLKIQRTERSEGAVAIKSAALKKKDLIRFRERSEQEFLFISTKLSKNPFRSLYLSMLSRYIPDTYPTHTRYIRICGEYSTNTPRISHEYPNAPPKMREAQIQRKLHPLLSYINEQKTARETHAVLSIGWKTPKIGCTYASI